MVLYFFVAESSSVYYVDHDETISTTGSGSGCDVLSAGSNLDLAPCDVEREFICSTGESLKCSKNIHFQSYFIAFVNKLCHTNFSSPLSTLPHVIPEQI